MIEEPPVLIIKRERPRPTETQIEALRNTPTGFLTDAMQGRGALDPAIRLLSPGVLPTHICGPALPCLCGPADILPLLGAISEVQSGDIVVAATGRWLQSAVIGDRVMGMLNNAGGAGFVTDGLVRDIEGIQSVGLPVMCAGSSPNSPYSKGPGEIGLPVQIGGISVGSGDMIVGDINGGVVVPYDRIDEVIATVSQIETLEESLDEEVANGLCVPESIRELMNSDQVAWV